jgi:RNA polymerase sigma-70 factor (ECF subfamily)
MTDSADLRHIADVLDGNTSSFTHLVEKYEDMLYTVVYRIVKNHEDAEELAQDAFVKAFNNLHNFKGNSKFSTWLYTIAYRAAISKTRLKVVDTINEGFLLESEDNSSSPISHLEEQEQAYYVKQAIAKLPEVDGVIVTLFYMDDASIQDIAEVTGLGESNVRVKLFRARKALKEHLHLMLQRELKNIV